MKVLADAPAAPATVKAIARGFPSAHGQTDTARSLAFAAGPTPAGVKPAASFPALENRVFMSEAGTAIVVFSSTTVPEAAVTMDDGATPSYGPSEMTMKS